MSLSLFAKPAVLPVLLPAGDAGSHRLRENLYVGEGAATDAGRGRVPRSVPPRLQPEILLPRQPALQRHAEVSLKNLLVTDIYTSALLSFILNLGPFVCSFIHYLLPSLYPCVSGDGFRFLVLVRHSKSRVFIFVLSFSSTSFIQEPCDDTKQEASGLRPL